MCSQHSTCILELLLIYHHLHKPSSHHLFSMTLSLSLCFSETSESDILLIRLKSILYRCNWHSNLLISCFKDTVSAIQEQRYHHGSEVNLPTLAHQNAVSQCLLSPRTGLQPHSTTDLNKIEGLASMGQHTIDSCTWVFLSVGCPCVEIKHTWHLYRYLIHVAIRQHPG